ncbi:MAG: hypothetical protein AAF340_05925 [Pseudomonadota bacterium]
MLKLLTRHYKRFGLFAFGMSCVSLSVVSRLDLGINQLGHLVFFAMSVASFLAIAFAVYSLIPGKRGILEIAGLTGLLTTFGIVYQADGYLSVALWIGIYILVFALISFVLRNQVSRSLGKKVRWQARHSIDLAFPAKIVWKHCVPGAGSPKDHCTGVIESYEPSPDDEDTIRATFKARRHGQAWYDITFLEQDAPKFCRFYFEGEEADGSLVDGMFTIAIEVTDRSSCTLIVHEERNGLPLHHLIERWFDDALAYHNDKLSEMLETRYGDGEGVTKPMSQAAE